MLRRALSGMSASVTKSAEMAIPAEEGGRRAGEGHPLAQNAEDDGGRQRHDQIDGDGLQVFIDPFGLPGDDGGGARAQEHGGHDRHPAQRDLSGLAGLGPESQDEIAHGHRRDRIHHGDQRGQHRAQQGREDVAPDAARQKIVQDPDEGGAAVV